ncbi:MAG: 50S ribosomal protein L22 [Proteobacteria bacterium]|nr:50S ribosomal protein L22 [Pseudomonadota bacterium]
MESRAVLRNVRVSARKARLIADMIRGKDVASAIKFLGFTNKKTAPMVAKIVKSAVANAEQVGVKDPDKLYVKTVFVDEGPTMKRFMPRAMGRATKILKRSSHITVVLAER